MSGKYDLLDSQDPELSLLDAAAEEATDFLGAIALDKKVPMEERALACVPLFDFALLRGSVATTLQLVLSLLEQATEAASARKQHQGQGQGQEQAGDEELVLSAQQELMLERLEKPLLKLSALYPTDWMAVYSPTHGWTDFDLESDADPDVDASPQLSPASTSFPRSLHDHPGSSTGSGSATGPG